MFLFYFTLCHTKHARMCKHWFFLQFLLEPGLQRFDNWLDVIYALYMLYKFLHGNVDAPIRPQAFTSYCFTYFTLRNSFRERIRSLCIILAAFLQLGRMTNKLSLGSKSTSVGKAFLFKPRPSKLWLRQPCMQWTKLRWPIVFFHRCKGNAKLPYDREKQSCLIDKSTKYTQRIQLNWWIYFAYRLIKFCGKYYLQRRYTPAIQCLVCAAYSPVA